MESAIWATHKKMLGERILKKVLGVEGFCKKLGKENSSKSMKPYKEASPCMYSLSTKINIKAKGKN